MSPLEDGVCFVSVWGNTFFINFTNYKEYAEIPNTKLANFLSFIAQVYCLLKASLNYRMIFVVQINQYTASFIVLYVLQKVIELSGCV